MIYRVQYVLNTFAAKHLKKTNTSVPSMFQGLLNIEGIWVQHSISRTIHSIAVKLSQNVANIQNFHLNQ